jgi:predicted nicotinamide N-methyase
MPPEDIGAFIRANTEIVAPPLVPEIRLHLATEITPIWHATEAQLETQGLPPPFWAFCWPGGQALARYLLDNPDIVSGRRVLEFAAGGAVSGIAAAMAGAASVTANDIDGFALTAAGFNAELNDVELEISADDLVRFGGADDFDVILAGDIFYEQTPAIDIEGFLRREAARGALVLIGDPGRKYLPRTGLTAIARYDVPTTLEIEDREIREGVVWRVD